MSLLDRDKLPSDYTEMMATEGHHNHEIVEVSDVIRWKENEGVRELVTMCDLGRMISDMEANGIGKNHEEYRRLYRNMGCSLSRYWEIFYWDLNNEDADKYVQPVAPNNKAVDNKTQRSKQNESH
jgi:hypothetical protein